MNEDFKQKNFYSLNLTEGRILVIFIFIILFITVLTFCITFIFFNKNKVDEVKLKKIESNNSISDNKKSQDYSYYGLSEESDSNLVNVYSEDKKENENLINSDEKSLPSEINDKENSKKEDKLIKYNQQQDKETDEIIKANKSSDIIKTDDSEILYSSKYKETNKSLNNKTELKSKANIKGKENQQKKIISKNYIVQIGSYINKKTAEEISGFYQKNGYHSFIVTKELNGKTYFRLRIGPFKERDQAIKYLSDIKKSKYGENSYLSIIYI